MSRHVHSLTWMMSWRLLGHSIAQCPQHSATCAGMLRCPYTAVQEAAVATVVQAVVRKRLAITAAAAATVIESAARRQIQRDDSFKEAWSVQWHSALTELFLTTRAERASRSLSPAVGTGVPSPGAGDALIARLTGSTTTRLNVLLSYNNDCHTQK